MLHAVIMAGGSGTRFWPASREALPKQLLPLAGARTMIQATVDRLGGTIPPERVMIVTGPLHAPRIREQLPELAADAVVVEPARRDTAPCIGLAAELLVRRAPDAVMAVLPADHVIEPAAAFRAALELADSLIQAEPRRIVTFGIRPTYPAESFGYIERGEPLPNMPQDAPPTFRVRRFREKPKADVAGDYLAAGTFYWNSGIFVWRAQTILDALEQYEPVMRERLAKIGASLGAAEFPATLQREFTAIQGKSIDYAVMEHVADDVVVVEAPFRWDDLGSWRAVARLRGEDAAGNTILARHLGIETRGSVIRGPEGHLIVTIGLEDCLIVHTPDATLVARKQDEEAVRKIVDLIREQGWTEYL